MSIKSHPPPNGMGAQLRATAPLRPARSAQVQCQTLPEIDWNTLWVVSCSDLLRGRTVQENVQRVEKLQRGESQQRYKGEKKQTERRRRKDAEDIGEM